MRRMKAATAYATLGYVGLRPRSGCSRAYAVGLRVLATRALRAASPWLRHLPFESYAFFGASPFVSFVPSPVRDAIRVAILRRASFSLRSNFRPPCLACASRPVRRMALKSSHSARHGPQPARFLMQYRYLLHISFAASGGCFHKSQN